MEPMVADDMSGTQTAKLQTDLNSSEDELLAINNEECEEEASWLSEVGLADLVSVILDQGQEVQPSTLTQVAEERQMTKKQLKAVKKRIDVLNATVKARKTRSTTHKRPDCRDIFRQQELSSAGCSSRSRSATPDSLDAGSPKECSSTENLLTIPDWGRPRSPSSRKTSSSSQRSGPSLSVEDIIRSLDVIADETDGHLRSLNQGFAPGELPHYMFSTAAAVLMPGGNKRRSSLTDEPNYKFKGKIAENESKASPIKAVLSLFDVNSEGHVAADKGIEVLRYEHVGTLSSKTTTVRSKRSGSDPLQPSWISYVTQPSSDSTLPAATTSYDDLNSASRSRLRQLALLEITALYDDHGLKLRTKKPTKKQSRNKGTSSNRHVFGVPLSKILEKDVAQEPGCKIPRILSTMISILEQNHATEEGILRVSGSHQKIAALQKLIDATWYSNANSVTNSLKNALAHDLAGVFKLFLRMLPESLLSNEYLDAFLQVDELPQSSQKLRALNLLCLLLPAAHRATLSALLRFLSRVAENQLENRMTVSNLATVISPSLFCRANDTKPVGSKTALNEELALTAQANRLTQILISHHEELFSLPASLLKQLSQTS